MNVTRTQYDAKGLLHQCVKLYIQKKGLDRDITEADVEQYVNEMAQGMIPHHLIQTCAHLPDNRVMSINHQTLGWAAMATRALPALQPFNDRWYFIMGITMEQLIWKTYWFQKANPPKDPPVWLQREISWYGVVWQHSLVGQAIAHLLRR